MRQGISPGSGYARPAALGDAMTPGMALEDVWI